MYYVNTLCVITVLRCAYYAIHIASVVYLQTNKIISEFLCTLLVDAMQTCTLCALANACCGKQWLCKYKQKTSMKDVLQIEYI